MKGRKSHAIVTQALNILKNLDHRGACGCEENTGDGAAFERKLYVIRKRAEHALAKSDLSERKFFYLPSLSARTFIYKGMLTPGQVELMFPDLCHESMQSALALVHSRFSTNTFPS